MRPFLKPSLFSRPVRRLSVVSRQGSVLRAGMGSLALCTLTGLAAAGAAGASAAEQSAAAAMPSASGAAVAQRDAGPLEWMMRAHQPASVSAPGLRWRGRRRCTTWIRLVGLGRKATRWRRGVRAFIDFSQPLSFAPQRGVTLQSVRFFLTGTVQMVRSMARVLVSSG